MRSRGCQGVARIDHHDQLRAAAEALLAAQLYGDTVIVEQYLGGKELTVTVLPGPSAALPPVRRFNHMGGIAPYNRAVAVTTNSTALTPAGVRTAGGTGHHAGMRCRV